jgi:hypothetical protein
LPDSGNYFATNNSGKTFLRMFHMEQFAKNQKSAKKEICGLFAFFENFGAGAPVVVLQRFFTMLPNYV